MDLAREARRIETMRHGDPTAVIGQGDVFVAPRLRRFCHPGDGDRAVGPVRVHVKVASHIRKSYKFGQFAGLRRCDFAAVLAQLRRDVSEPELLVDVFLGSAGDPPLAGEQAVFVQLPAAVIGEPAQRDVVGFRAGEIKKRRAIAFLRHSADIDLQAGTQHHGGAGRPVGYDLRDIFIFHQPVADRGAVFRGHQHVEIADGVAPPPITAGDDDAPATAEIADQGLGLGFGHRELEPFRRLGLFKRLQQFLLDHGAESADLAQPPGLDGLTKVIERAHFQPVIEQLDALRPESGKRRHIAELAREFPFQGVEQTEMSGLDNVGYLAGQILADPRQFRQIASGLQQACDCLGQALDLARGTAVGADAKLVLSPDLEQLGGLVEHGSDFRILNGHVGDPRKPYFAKEISHGSTGRN